MQYIINYQFAIFKVIIILTALFGISSFPISVVQAATNNTIQLRLLDTNGNPIPRVHLIAWRVNSPQSQTTGSTRADGVAILNLPPGQYYMTGDITELKNRMPYATGLKSYNTTTLYFVSRPLTIDSGNYIDISDIAESKGFQVRINQKNLGIETTIHTGNYHNWLRLYLPTRMQYTLQQVEGALHMQWSIYAAPGLQFILSSY